ncbi:LuxR C-terminal-related transcriptional regulator [Streptomyces heilongjiangensis]|uniref:LuxR C-terminal-related transcriptional regulator n=1 Tax=Streptomyces heilongjiangensis TaxID=945052 RepID=A0ABW1BG39_9ACTN|nr:response regulator transcription factor [Streptomyces heilongjiangensis]MDC2952368.1 response regulator transcription factor [Streptomyces heilongjiangensis]
MKTNLFVISDSPITFAGLEAIIEQDEGFVLTGRAVGSSDVTRCLEDTELQPDVVILGEPSSKRTICETVQQIVSHYHRKKSRSKIIVVSEQDEDDVIVAALQVGVNGYLTRIRSSEELLHAIRIVAEGGATFSPTIASRLSRYFSKLQSGSDLTEFSDLTSRELEILELVARGLGNQQIARRLFLAEKTVRNYVSRIFTKLEVHDRATAVVVARDAGLGGHRGVPAPQSI